MNWVFRDVPCTADRMVFFGLENQLILNVSDESVLQ